MTLPNLSPVFTLASALFAVRAKWHADEAVKAAAAALQASKNVKGGWLSDS